ncbi:hypothetical protein N7G274_003909 [Stereocaulon virgatum]|uniref:F-box domain-containing protein n=1 Tax=Stereocaulon virgatum TaxID=373712 RepID=A0ABR4ACN3_9LECA
MASKLTGRLLALPHRLKSKKGTRLTRTGSNKKSSQICDIRNSNKPSRLDRLPTELLLEIIIHLGSVKGPIRWSLSKPLGSKPAAWGNTNQATNLARTCKRFYALINDLLYTKTWFEFSGGNVRDPYPPFFPFPLGDASYWPREIYYGMRLARLRDLSFIHPAQKFLTNLRINIVGRDIEEFKDPSFAEALKRLQGLKTIELNPIRYEADVLLCNRLGPYLLSLTELDHVPNITLAKQERRLWGAVREDFRQFTTVLQQRNKNHSLSNMPKDKLFLLEEEVRGLIRKHA